MSATKRHAATPPSGQVRGPYVPVDRFAGLRRIPALTKLAIGIVRVAAGGPLVRSIALQLLNAAALGVQLYFVKELVQGLLTLSGSGTVPEDVLTPFAVLVVTSAILGVSSAILGLQEQLLVELVARHVLGRIVAVGGKVPLSYFEDATYYDRLQRAISAGMYRPSVMVSSLMALLLAVVTSVGVTIALLLIAPVLVPLVFLAAVPVLLATLYNARKDYAFEYNMTPQARERVHLLGLLTQREAAKELRVFEAIAYLRRRFDELADERISKVHEFLRGRTFVAVTGSLGTAIGTAIALGALVLLLADGRIGVASATAAAVAMQVLASRLATITGSVGRLVETSLYMSDLEHFLAQDVDPAPAGSRPAGRFERLEVRDLSFTYPGTQREVLHSVDLELNRGEVVALVGENGSGKTTLVKLLCRLYDHEVGSVCWNGHDVLQLDPAELRSQMTVLFQDFVQYQLSVDENIALGRSEVPFDDERIEEAARRAGADEVAAQLPDGYDTRLGREFEGGAELSGGQWQRLALARAFYRGGDFLILDEPTAALDPRAEQRLFDQMRDLAAGRTVLLISHRFGSVRMADRIYVLKDGSVAESGTHDALIARDGLYAELFRMQAAAYIK